MCPGIVTLRRNNSFLTPLPWRGLGGGYCTAVPIQLNSPAIQVNFPKSRNYKPTRLVYSGSIHRREVGARRVLLPCSFGRQGHKQARELVATSEQEASSPATKGALGWRSPTSQQARSKQARKLGRRSPRIGSGLGVPLQSGFRVPLRAFWLASCCWEPLFITSWPRSWPNRAKHLGTSDELRAGQVGTEEGQRSLFLVARRFLLACSLVVVGQVVGFCCFFRCLRNVFLIVDFRPGATPQRPHSWFHNK